MDTRCSVSKDTVLTSSLPPSPYPPGHGLEVATWLRAGVVGQPKRNPHSGDIIGSSRSTSDVTAKVRDQAAVDLIAVLRCSKSHCHFIINQAYMASWEELREFGLLFLCKLVCHNS